MTRITARVISIDSKVIVKSNGKTFDVDGKEYYNYIDEGILMLRSNHEEIFLTSILTGEIIENKFCNVEVKN